jgi:hypothetical protein
MKTDKNCEVLHNEILASSNINNQEVEFPWETTHHSLEVSWLDFDRQASC